MAVNKQVRSDESALSRWSRRKLEADRDDADTAPAVEPGPVGEAAAISAQPAEEKPLSDADMPDIDSLSAESDFSGFMSSGVSDELRNLALRKLFHAPVFNIRDGLDEYDEDYTSFEKLGDIVTCDMKHQVEMQEKKRREAQELEQQAALEEAELDDVEMIEEDEQDAGLEVDGIDENEASVPVDDALARLQPEQETKQN